MAISAVKNIKTGFKWIVGRLNGGNSGLLLLGLLFIYYVVCFAITLESGYSGDDVLNSSTHGIVYKNVSITDFTITVIKHWLSQGRVFPFGLYFYGFYSVVTSRVIYKFIIIVSVYLNCVLFGQYLKKMTGSERIKQYAMLLLPILIQLSAEYYSALFAFHMLMQLLLMWLLLTLLLLMKSIEKGKLYLSIISAGFLLVALGTYEIAFIYILFIFLTVYTYHHNVKSTLKSMIPQLVVYGLMLLVNAYFRLTMSRSGYAGITFNLDISAIGITYLKQCSSVFPLGRYFATYGRPGYPYTLSELLAGVTLSDGVLIGLFLVISLLMTRWTKNESPLKNMGVMALIGVLLFALPGMLIAVSVKYQNELVWGLGHLPSYIQSYGLLVLCTLLVYGISRIKRGGIRIPLKICGMLVVVYLICVNQQVGRISVEGLNVYFRWPRENVENAVAKGILGEVKSDDLLIGTTNYLFDIGEGDKFYSNVARKDIHEVPEALYCSEIAGGKKEGKSSSISLQGKKYAIISYAEKKFGYVVAGECVEWQLDKSKTRLSQVAVINPQIYLQGEYKDIKAIDGLMTEDLKSSDYQFKTLPFDETEIIHRDQNSVLYRIALAGKIDLKSLHLFRDKIDAYYTFGKGFSGVEGSAPNDWLWISNDAEILVYNRLAKNMTYKFTADVESMYPEKSGLTIGINEAKNAYVVNNQGVAVSQEIILKPGKNVITFKTDAKRVPAPNDPREIYLRLRQFSVIHDFVMKN